MEQYFRTAIWMFCLVAYLQAKPVRKCDEVKFDLVDLDFKSLNTSCENVTFKTPHVTTQHHAAALDLFITELSRATEDCKHEDLKAELLADQVQLATPDCLEPVKDETCQWEMKEYKDFVQRFETFLTVLNDVYAKP